MADYTTTNKMMQIIQFVNQLIELDYNPIIILDIDDTCLSSQCGKKIVDNDVTILANIAYDLSPNNLWFLTARNPEYKRKTMNHLNRAKLLHKGQFIKYNVIYSPWDDFGGATKGTTLINSIGTRIQHNEKNWYIIVDDDLDQINDMCNSLKYNTLMTSIFHFVS